MKKHTLVAHLCPDLEVLFMIHLIRSDERVRDRLGLDGQPALKFIPAGPLSACDWTGVTAGLSVEELEKLGYLFLDCGGGVLDQHNKQSLLKNSMSSLDLLVHYADIDEGRPEIMPIVEVISQNDLSGQDIVRDNTYRQSRTPHTPRHLRNVVLGWNLLYRDQPEKVVALADMAFRGIEQSLMRAVGEELCMEKRHGDDGSLLTGALEQIDCRQLFLADAIVNGVFTDIVVCGDAGLDTAEAEKGVCRFRDEVEAALDAMEAEWELGVQDYLKRTKIVRTAYGKEVDGAAVYREIAVAYGFSESTRFGPVTRFGNESQGRRGRPYQQCAERPKADVTIQLYGNGRFLISTKGIELGEVASAIRRADLMRKGVALGDAQASKLSDTGHLTFTSRVGEQVQALYLAEYRTAFGNAFRANPRAAATALEDEEIVTLTLKALSREPSDK